MDDIMTDLGPDGGALPGPNGSGAAYGGEASSANGPLICPCGIGPGYGIIIAYKWGKLLQEFAALDMQDPRKPSALDPHAGDIESVGSLGHAPPTAESVTDMLNDHGQVAGTYMSFLARGTGPTETAGVIVVDRFTGNVLIIRERRSSGESGHASGRDFCRKKAALLVKAFPQYSIVAGVHTHPSGRNGSLDDRDAAAIVAQGYPEIIVAEVRGVGPNAHLHGSR